MSQVISISKLKKSLLQFIQQFNSLDIKNYGNWSFSIQMSCWIVIFLIVMIVGGIMFVFPQLNAVHAEHSKRAGLLQEFREKTAKLQQLKQYQVQLQQVKIQFDQQLEQLPKETELPRLLDDISFVAKQTGLELVHIGLEDEIKQAILIEQPIRIEAVGDYHAFGAFSSGIAALPRIVTVHDFIVEVQTKTKQQIDIPKIHYVITAKTYRYAHAQDQTKT